MCRRNGQLPGVCTIDTYFKTCKWSGKGVSSLDMSGKQTRDERGRLANKLMR